MLNSLFSKANEYSLSAFSRPESGTCQTVKLLIPD